MLKFNKKKNRFLCVLALALFVCLFSVHAVAGVNAKYVSSASGTATAQIAKFRIGSTMAVLDPSLCTLNLNFYDPSKVTDTFDFAVYSESEVSVRYSVIVTTSATVSNSAWLDICLGSKIPTVDTVSVPGKVIYTFSDVGEFAPYNPLAVASHNLNLIFTINEIYLGNQEILGETPNLDFSVTVKVEQID